MSNIEEKTQTLARLVSAAVTATYGEDANFIIIPVLEVEDGVEMAIASSMGKEITAITLMELAVKAMKYKNDIKSKEGVKADVINIKSKKDSNHEVN